MEKYKQITTSYYRGAQAAVICFDLTSNVSFNSLTKWVEDFSHYYNKIFQKFVVIVGTKADLVEEREVQQEEINKYVEMNGFKYFETSSKNLLHDFVSSDSIIFLHKSSLSRT